MKLRALPLLACICVALPSVAHAVAPSMRGPSAQADTLDVASPHRAPSIALRYYRRYVTIADGDRCRMMPSCSVYAHEAFARHGWIKGFLLTADRLTRCSNDMNCYESIWVNNIRYAMDPVPDDRTTR